MQVNAINQLTGRIIKAGFEVSNELGVGFLERVYDNALAIALQDEGLAFVRRKRLQVRFRSRAVGDFEPDFIVEGVVLVEIKATRTLTPDHMAQGINYLSTAGLQVGLLLNFGRTKLQIPRLVRGLGR